MNDVMFSSNSCEWETPQDLFDKLDKEFHFFLDVCATPENAKCKNYFTKELDGLNQPWANVCWMNPPYGKEMKKWIEKAYCESEYGVTVVCLVPARTDTYWWHEFCMKGDIRFIRGRLKFGGCKWNAPFPSAIVIFRGKSSCEDCKFYQKECDLYKQCDCELFVSKARMMSSGG